MQRSERSDVTSAGPMTASVQSVHSIADRTRCGQNRQQRTGVPTRLARRSRLSPSSASSCSSGEFIPHLRHSVPERSAVPEQDDSLAVTRCKLRSMSRDQVLRLLFKQRDEVARRETELSNLSSGK